MLVKIVEIFEFSQKLPGKVGVKSALLQKRRDLSKAERRQRSAQLRASKSAKLMEQRRLEGGAPHLVVSKKRIEK